MKWHYLDLSSTSDRLVEAKFQRDRTNQVDTSIEFLRLFSSRYLAEKPVVASQNVGCFRRLIINKENLTFLLERGCNEPFPPKKKQTSKQKETKKVGMNF